MVELGHHGKLRWDSQINMFCGTMLLWGQHGWLSEVIIVGCGGLTNQHVLLFYAALGPARMAEWGHHVRLGWDSQIKMVCCFVLLWGKHSGGAGARLTDQHFFVVLCCLQVTTDGWVGSSWYVGVRLTHQHVLLFYIALCFCSVSTDGWVGSSWWVGVRLTDQHFLLFCACAALGQVQWVSGVRKVGWGEAHTSTCFAIYVVLCFGWFNTGDSVGSSW